MDNDRENSWEESSSSSEEEEEDDDENKDAHMDEESEEEVEIEDHSSDNETSKLNSRQGKKVSNDKSSSSEEEEEVKDEDQEGESGSDSSDDNDDDNSQSRRKGPKRITDDDKKAWQENPEVFGIRRSGRARREVQRFTTKDHFASDDSDDSAKRRRARGRQKNRDWMPNLSESDSDSNSSFDAGQKSRTKPNKPTGLKKKSAPAKFRQRSLSSSSDEEFGKSRRKKSHQKKQRSSSATRRTATGVSYKEDSDEQTDSDDIIEADTPAGPVAPVEEVETIEKVMRHRQGRPSITGAQTTIYAVEADEIAKLGEPDPQKDETELQFLIKWKTWSHLHNTWESVESLKAQRAAGMKKLENYMKKLDEINNWKSIASPEDVEYFECQQDMNDDLAGQYQTIERIIAHQKAEDGSMYPDYFCKWVGLPYSDCSWESGELVVRYAQKHIDDYLNREGSNRIPNRNAKCLRHRPKFVPHKTQPDFIGSKKELELRTYQLDGVNWLVHSWCREMSSILADEMGLGKTIQTVSFLSCLFHTHELYGPYLVVVPLSTIDAWQREFSLWAPDMNLIVYIGDVESRTKIQEYEWCFPNRKLKFNVLLTTYEMLLRDKEVLGPTHWAALVVDEAHRLKNEDSLLYRILVDFHTNYRLLITGTPLQNSLKELWSLMHFIMKDRFNSWTDFESQYSLSEKDGYQKLHKELEPFLLRRVKKDVEKSLPNKVEQILRVEMSQIQKHYYKLILTKNVKELCKEVKGSFTGLLNIIVELKKCCNHAHLISPFDPSGDQEFVQALIRGSGKMILLDKLLCRLKEKGHRVLIFSQMVRMLDIIADYLALKRFQFQRLDGGIKGELRKKALDHFNAEGSQDFCFLLSTRAGGLGINLASADTVIIFDSDWNPQNDLQAMARAHRIGQKNQVNIYRLVTKNTIEEDIIERAKKKMVLDHLIIQRMDTTGRRILAKNTEAPSKTTPFKKEELSLILKFGAEDLFKDTDGESDKKLQEMDIDDILQRAETQEINDNSMSVGEELLSQFKVVDYSTFEEDEPKKSEEPTSAMAKLWEEIIPEEERKKVEQEEEEQKQKELNLGPRERKRVTKLNVGHDDEKKAFKTPKYSSQKPNSKFKSKEYVESDSSSSVSDVSDDSDDSDDAREKASKKKQKPKPKSIKSDNAAGFSDAEVRRFVKSYKKFANAMSRLDAIAEDAELSDKSTTELQQLAELIKKECSQAVKEYEEKLLQDDKFDGKKKGATIKISNVSINAHSVLTAEEELEHLAATIPQDPVQQKNYRLTVRTRSVHWGIVWSAVDDSMLLVGMLNHGVGNWESIKNDQNLGLTTKILPPGAGKPQDRHLQSRADYLLKVLKEQQAQNDLQETKKKNKSIKKREKNSASESSHAEHSTTSKSVMSPAKSSQGGEEVMVKEKPVKKERKKRAPKAPKESPTDAEAPDETMHDENRPSVQAEQNAPVVIDNIEKMDEQTFKECKDKMRHVKSSLKFLRAPEEGTSEKDQVNKTRQCLLKIGDHILKCLDELYQEANSKNTDKREVDKVLDELRSKLWSFVAKFTEFTPAKLYKLYRSAAKKRDGEKAAKKKEIQKLKTNYTQSLHEVGRQSRPDRLELERQRKRALGLDQDSPANKIPKLNKIKIPHKEKMGKKQQQDWNNQPHNNRDRHQNSHYHQNQDRPNRGGFHNRDNWRGNRGHHHNRGGGHQHGNDYRRDRGRWHDDEKPPRDYYQRHHPPYDEKPSEGPPDHNPDRHYSSFNRRPRYGRDRPGYSAPPNHGSGGAPSYTVSYDYHHASPGEHMDSSNSPDSWARQRTYSNNGGYVEPDKRGPPANYSQYSSRNDVPPSDAPENNTDVASSEN